MTFQMDVMDNITVKEAQGETVVIQTMEDKEVSIRRARLKKRIGILISVVAALGLFLIFVAPNIGVPENPIEFLYNEALVEPEVDQLTVTRYETIYLKEEPASIEKRLRERLADWRFTSHRNGVLVIVGKGNFVPYIEVKPAIFDEDAPSGTKSIVFYRRYVFPYNLIGS